jgi:hypothetical protein
MFSQSFVRHLASGASRARTQIESRCILEGPDGTQIEWLHAAPYTAEHGEYSRTKLSADNPYDFVEVVRRDGAGFVNHRFGADYAGRWLTVGDPRLAEGHDGFTCVDWSLTFAPARRLAPDEVFHAVCQWKSLVGRTVLTDLQTGVRATLEYPIRGINIRRDGSRRDFQVDTGPICIPLSSEPSIEVSMREPQTPSGYVTKQVFNAQLQTSNLPLLGYVLFNNMLSDSLDFVELVVRDRNPARFPPSWRRLGNGSGEPQDRADAGFTVDNAVFVYDKGRSRAVRSVVCSI